MSCDRGTLPPRFRDWFSRQLPGASDLRLSGIFEPRQGYSSRTIVFTAHWHEGDAQHEKGFVARLQQTVSCPLLADIFHQQRVMSIASAHSGVQVPKPVAMEPSAEVLGVPFFVMERAEGQVPPDFPSYHAQGWVVDLPVADRSRLWWNGMGAMMRLHSIDWREFSDLAEGQSETPDARFYIRRFIVPWFEWAANGREFPAIASAIEELGAKAPPVSRAGLAWNDARPGNVMFGKNKTVSALFDFEVATLGPAEIDIAWWLYADVIFSEAFGLPRLPGIPTAEEALPELEQLYGRPLPDLSYYLALAAVKHAVISIRDYGNDKRAADEVDHIGFALSHFDRYLADWTG